LKGAALFARPDGRLPGRGVYSGDKWAGYDNVLTRPPAAPVKSILDRKGGLVKHGCYSYNSGPCRLLRLEPLE
jgi:hypothetical protein